MWVPPEMREPFHFRHRCEQVVGVRVQHFRDAGVIGVGIGKDEKQRLSAKATKVAQDDVPSDVFVRIRNDMELTVLGFQAQPGDHGRADRAKTFAITEGKADVEHPAAYFGAIGLEHNLREVSLTLIVRKLGHIGAIDFRGGRQPAQGNVLVEHLTEGFGNAG